MMLVKVEGGTGRGLVVRSVTNAGTRPPLARRVSFSESPRAQSTSREKLVMAFSMILASADDAAEGKHTSEQRAQGRGGRSHYTQAWH